MLEIEKNGITTCTASGGLVQIRNNLFYANRTGNWNIEPGLCEDSNNVNDDISGNIPNSDPSFIDPYADWHIQSGSPAIGAGLNFYDTITTDYEGKPRPETGMGGFDIGAYEQQ